MIKMKFPISKRMLGSHFAPSFGIRLKHDLEGGKSFVKWQYDELNPNVARLVLNNPDKLNSLTVEMGKDFSIAVDDILKACHKGDVRAVVLTGAGSAFSAGGDTAWLLERRNESPEKNSRIMRDFYRSFLCIRDLPVPVIAAINGPAIGAGLCLAMACDIRIAAFKSKLGLTFVSLGIHPGMACTHFLPRLIGPQAAKRLLFTADTISGSEALDLGLVSEVTEQEDVLTRAGLLAARIAQNSPVAVQQCVKTLRMAEEDLLESAMQREADAQALCYANDNLTEGILANKQKRVPNFESKK